MAISLLCKNLRIACEGGITCVGIDLTLMRRTSLHLQHDLTRTTCYQLVLRGVFLRLSTSWCCCMPRQRAWIGPVKLICAAWSLLYIYLGVVPSNFCRTIPGVQLEHCLVSLLANPSFLRYSILLCPLHTDRFPHSVVILGGRLWRGRIAGSENRPLRHSMSYNVCIGVASVDSYELLSSVR